MARKKGGRKQKAKQKASSKPDTAADSEIEEGQIVEEDEIMQDFVKETDYGHSSCSSSNTTPEKEQKGLSLAAALLPLEPIIDIEKQTAEPTDEPTEVDKANGSLGSKGEQPNEQSNEVRIEETPSNNDKPDPSNNDKPAPSSTTKQRLKG